MAPLDVLSFEEAQSALRSFGATNAPDIEAMVSGISSTMDEILGPVVIREVTATLSGPISGPLMFLVTPVAEITEVVESDAGTDTTLTADDYTLEGEHHYWRLFRRTGFEDTTWAAGRRNITVTYDAGRFASTEEVSYRWKEGARSLLIAKWRHDASAWHRNPNTSPDDINPDLGVFDLEEAVRTVFHGEVLGPFVAA